MMTYSIFIGKKVDREEEYCGWSLVIYRYRSRDDPYYSIFYHQYYSQKVQKKKKRTISK